MSLFYYSPKPLDPIKLENYLKMIAQCLSTLNRNYGALRKDIWDQMCKDFGSCINYQEFLVAIYQLNNDGKLHRNDNGYF